MRRRASLPHAPEYFELLEGHGFPDVVPRPASCHDNERRQFVEVRGLGYTPFASPGGVAFMLACCATTSAAAIMSAIDMLRARNLSSVNS
jgi:hypothetical protein